MPDQTNTVKHISLERLELYDSLLKNYIDAADAKALKTVALSPSGDALYFYTVEEPVGTTPPAFTIEFPETNLDPYILKVANAIAGNVPTLTADGSLQDSGIAAVNLADKAYVDTAVANGIASTTHLSKLIVTTLPAASAAADNTIYLIKRTTASGNDQYEEWLKIGNELVMIGDTSTDMSQYSTTAQMNAAIATAKSEALAEAALDYNPKIDAALEDANDYTDEQLAPISSKVTTLENNYNALSDNVSDLNATVSDHTSRIEALEAGGVDIEIATEEDIRSLFTSGS